MKKLPRHKSPEVQKILLRYYKRPTMSVTEEAYNQTLVPSKTASKSRAAQLKPLYTDRSATRSPHINKTVFNKMDKNQRSKVLQIACQGSNVLDLFHTRKLFVNAERSYSPFIPNKIDPIEASASNKDDIASSRTINKNKALDRPEFSNEGIKTAMEYFKTADSSSKSSYKKLSPKRKLELTQQNKNNMCQVLKTIANNCEILKNTSKSGEKLEDIKKKKINYSKFTDNNVWDAYKLHEWANFKEPILKELHDHNQFTKIEREADNLNLSKEIANKTLYEIRSQARFIKRVLLRHREKLL